MGRFGNPSCCLLKTVCLILKFTSLGDGVIDIPAGYEPIDKYNGTMAHKFNHKFYRENCRPSYVRSQSEWYGKLGVNAISFWELASI